MGETTRDLEAARLREIRLRRGESGGDFARSLGVCASMLSELENGRRRVSRKVADRYARVLGVKAWEVLRMLEEGHSRAANGGQEMIFEDARDAVALHAGPGGGCEVSGVWWWHVEPRIVELDVIADDGIVRIATGILDGLRGATIPAGPAPDLIPVTPAIADACGRWLAGGR